MNISYLEKVIGTNIGNYMILPQLSIKDYVNLGLVNKYIYKLLKIDIYNKILQNVPKIAVPSIIHTLEELSIKEFNNISLPSIISTEYNIIKYHSLTPIHMLHHNSKWKDIKYNKKWIITLNNTTDIFKLYYIDNNEKIVMSYMAPLLNIGNPNDNCFDDVIRIFEYCVLCGISPSYEYLMISEYNRKNTLFMVFNKPYVKSVIQCLYEYYYEKDIVKNIVKALYRFVKKLIYKPNNKLDRIGHYIIVRSDYINCVIEKNNIDVFLSQHFITTGMPLYIDCLDHEYIALHWRGIKKEITRSLQNVYYLHTSIINLLMKEFDKY